MEVLLESADGHSSLKNTFVSMRIGDVQKQSRFSEPRKYVFPDPGESRQSFGRIEVFKRVGFTTVNFENFEGKPQDIEVPCDGPDDRLRLKLQVNSNLRVDPQLEKVAKTKARLDAATKYLQDHRLEEILADAMRDVIHDRPQDPLQFLSAKLLEHIKAPVKPPAVEAASKPEQKVEASKPSPAKSAAGPLHTMITTLPSSSLDRLYAKFPLSPEAAKAVAKAAKGSPTAFKTMPTGAYTSIYGKFPSFAKAEASAKAAASKPSGAAGGPNKEFGKLASVGTWLAPKPKGARTAAGLGGASAAKKEKETPTYRGWTLRPSVGTWLAPKPDNAEDLGASTLTLYADEEDLLHTMSDKELIKVFRQQLKKKDEEICSLKRSMGRTN